LFLRDNSDKTRLSPQHRLQILRCV